MKNAIKLHSKKYFLGFIQLILAVAFLASAAQAATYVVTNTADSGAGSLRQAILDANANAGADTINFNIAGSGVRTIVPQSPGLPEITDSVTINGTSQPGYAGNPLIEIDGSGITQIYSGITVRNGNVIIKALVIRDFPRSGIQVECSTNCDSKPASLVLTGSRIGTNSDGTVAAGNGWNGIDIYTNKAATSQIGGPGANEKNVISGNGYGIRIHNDFEAQLPDNSFLIINNMIGTNLAGTAALPNDTGIGIKASRVTIGGDAPAERNVISGNNFNGISIGWNQNSDDYNVIEGNYIGTNAAGTAALGNQHDGISMGPSDNNRIGGLQPGTGNVISGNGKNGISFYADAYTPSGEISPKAFGANDNLIYGNKIGTNAAGTAAVGNGYNGISIIGNNNSIGLSGVAASSNIISGNGKNGVVVHDWRQWYGNLGPHHTKSKGNKIQLNYIGTNSAGADLGNAQSGVLILGETTDTLVGGGSVAENTIAHNNGNGISLEKADYTGLIKTPFDNHFTGNKIHSNTLRGIKIYENDSQANDQQDADEGINNLQNAPVLSGAYVDAITGSLHSTPNKTFNLDFYSSPTCDDSGKGEGQTYLNTISVTTDANGNASFETFFGAASGSAVTATATAPPASGNTYGSTSEFSQCVTATAQQLTKISFSQAAYSVGENGATATITATRTGGLIYPASVSYATIAGGTATAGQDYTATSGTLNFNAGQATKTFTVAIANDTADESDETVNLALSNPSANGMLINPSTAVLTITDNDNPPTVSIKNFATQEGNTGTTPFIFDVSLTEASGFPVSVKWKTLSGGTATPGSDYTAADGTLNFAPGETSRQVTVLVNGDAVSEPNEYFQVNIYQPVNVALGDSLANGAIFDEDNPGELKFSPAVYNVNEGVGAATVTVTRTTGTVGTVTVDYATTNTGTTSFPDFTPASGTLTFLDGEATKTFSVSITDDQIVEQTEWINLVLSNATGGAAITGGNALINIDDNDTASATSISGIVNYAITSINQSPKKVPGVLVYATGPGNGAATSDSDGAYQINNLTAGGNYTVVASKTGDRNGISPFDATLVLRHVAASGQGPNALSVNQQKAADTNGDGNISPFDATLILRYIAANGPNANTGQTGNWKFLPSTQNYQSLNNSLSGENYEAVLIGEINGDWTAPAPGSLASMDNQDEIAASVEEAEIAKTDESNSDAEISLPIELSATDREDTLVVPVLLTNYAGRTVSGFSFDLRYDPTVLQPDETMAIDTNETLSQGFSVVHSITKSGRIGVAVGGGSSINDIKANGVLLKLRFKVVRSKRRTVGGETSLTFRQTPIFEDNEGAPLTVKRTNGSVRVSLSNVSNEAPPQ